jgi:hypothetical protein
MPVTSCAMWSDDLRGNEVQIKLEFMTECDAQSVAMYFDDRGYGVS